MNGTKSKRDNSFVITSRTKSFNSIIFVRVADPAGLDPDSIGSVDPDPYSGSGSVFGIRIRIQ
jgi:hypothetical protein